MSNTDIDAVAARRAQLVRNAAKLEKQRAVLMAEDEELALTERVLLRLGEMEAVTEVDEAQDARTPVTKTAAGALANLLGMTLPQKHA